MKVMPLTLPLLAALLLTLPLRAQDLPTLTAPPQLPVGLTWTMSEREVIAVLKEAGLEPRLTLKGERFTKKQIRRIAQRQGYSEQTVRDAQTWKDLFCGVLPTDSGYPKAVLSIEFLRNRIFELRFTWTIENEEQRQALARLLRERYQAWYRFDPVESWSRIPVYPPGQIIDSDIDIMIGSRGYGVGQTERRAFFHSWDGVFDGRIYGTLLRGGIDEYVVLRHKTGPLPEVKTPTKNQSR